LTIQCPQREWLSTEKYLEKFSSKAERLRIPISGSLELTHRCNFNCVHCYLGPQSERLKKEAVEMSTDRILSLLDEITAAGCLNLLITGGEPLIREDFPVIYRHAKKNGLLITLFTNGTLLNGKVLDLFVDLPPLEVEISIYGSTASTYERITRVPGSYERCFQNIERLLEKDIKVNLKTILMTINSHELEEMENIAGKFGVRFRFDAAISPYINGDKTPLKFRVSPEEAIEKEFSDRKRLQSWIKFYEKFKDWTLGNTLYVCGAGVTGFHIDPYGYLQPCMTTLEIRYNITKAEFMSGWKDITQHISNKKTKADFTCRGCEKINLCGYCPDFFRLENSSESLCSDYLCKMGNLRFEYITNNLSKGGHSG
jgi:radical SAM protein with 4Fe4S-binding SPASM domain